MSDPSYIPNESEYVDQDEFEDFIQATNSSWVSETLLEENEMSSTSRVNPSQYKPPGRNYMKPSKEPIEPKLIDITIVPPKAKPKI